ncbi:MAG: lipopolysaccharide heptosyltransferase II [Verrucomicrobiia bacterium]|jgi:heptosyltransferase-2
MSLSRILIRSVNWLGDAVMTMPAIQRLKQAHPQAQIAVLTGPKLADLWRLHPDVNEVIVHEQSNCPFVLLRQARELRRGAFDAAIIFSNSWRSALPTWLAGIPRRIGFRGHARAWMLTERLGESADYQTKPVMTSEAIRRFGNGLSAASERPVFKHQVHRHLQLAACLGADATPCAPQLQLAAPPADALLPQDKPLLALNAGAEYGPAKRWPLDRFIAAAKVIVERHHVRWVILGGPKEGDLGREIATALGAPNAINLAGQTTLLGLCHALAQCRLLLTNDSGPMHLAAALGKPVVAMFGSTEPALTGPNDSRHVILRHAPPCSPCFMRECPIDFRCMTAITVEEVVKAAERVISNQ